VTPILHQRWKSQARAKNVNLNLCNKWSYIFWCRKMILTIGHLTRIYTSKHLTIV